MKKTLSNCNLFVLIYDESRLPFILFMFLDGQSCSGMTKVKSLHSGKKEALVKSKFCAI